MLKLTRALFLAAAFSVCGTASAETIYDDFKTKWKTLRLGSGTVLSTVRNRLEVTLGADAASGSDFFARGLSSTCTVGGDFDLRVSYRLLDWSAGNGVRTALYLGNPARIDDESTGVWVERDSYSHLEGGPREVYVFFGAGDILQEVDTAHTSGRLRLTRVGPTVTGYYRQGGRWVALSSTQVGREDIQFAILAMSHDSVFANTLVRVAFDDVVLAAGSFQGAACPFAAP